VAVTAGHAVLVLSQYVEERYASELLSADTQAIGYLLKECVADVATSSTPSTGRTAARCSTRRSSARCGPPPLRPARSLYAAREVLALMAEGRSNAGIAQALVVPKVQSRSTSRRSSAASAWPRPTPSTAVLAVLTGCRA
jgi:DNA-binding NarL/FixJ family response regulator